MQIYNMLEYVAAPRYLPAVVDFPHKGLSPSQVWRRQNIQLVALSLVKLNKLALVVVVFL